MTSNVMQEAKDMIANKDKNFLLVLCIAWTAIASVAYLFVSRDLRDVFDSIDVRGNKLSYLLMTSAPLIIMYWKNAISGRHLSFYASLMIFVCIDSWPDFDQSPTIFGFINSSYDEYDSTPIRSNPSFIILGYIALEIWLYNKISKLPSQPTKYSLPEILPKEAFNDPEYMDIVKDLYREKCYRVIIIKLALVLACALCHKYYADISNPVDFLDLYAGPIALVGFSIGELVMNFKDMSSRISTIYSSEYSILSKRDQL